MADDARDEMDAGDAGLASLLKYTDSDGVAYYQLSQVKKLLGVPHLERNKRYSNVSMRRAEIDEYPDLRDLGMCIRRGVVLVRADHLEAEIKRTGGFVPSEQQTGQSPKKKRKKRKKRWGPEPSLRTVKTRVRFDEVGKPPYTFTQLAGQALLQSQKGGMTRQEVCDWIMQTYPFYQSYQTKCTLNTLNALRTSKFFSSPTNDLHSEWSVVPEQRTLLENKAFMHSVGRISAGGPGTSAWSPESPSASGVTEVLFLNEVDENEMVVEDSLSDAVITPEAVRSIADQENRPIKEEVTGSRAHHGRPGVVTTPIPVPSVPIKSRKLYTIDLTDSDDDEYMRVMTREELNDLFAPSPIIDTIDLTADKDSVLQRPMYEDRVQCPMCGASFTTKADLGEHVLVHSHQSRVKSAKMEEAFESIASSFSRERKTPVYIFSGNVYFNSNPLAAS